MIEEIQNIFKQNNIEINTEQAKKFEKYINLLTEYNKVMNLTAIIQPKEVILKHFVDCCLPYKLFKQQSSVCDVGSGAGFPSIPLKIIRDDLNIIMVDSLQKRVNFLNILIKELELTNIKAIHSRAQEFCQNNRETFDNTTARAVAPLNILNELCLPLTKLNGQFIVYKSQNIENELNEAQNSLNIFGGKVENVLNMFLKGENETFERNIVLINKIKQTPKKYPRLKDKINKKPL